MFNGDTADFLGQIPPTVILMFCGFMLLMVVSLVLLVLQMRRKRAAKQDRPAPGCVPVLDAEVPLTQDLPDLDLLVGSEPARVPASRFVPVAPAAPPAAEPVPLPVRKSGTYWLGLTDGRQVEAAEVLTVSRDLAAGSLIVQIGQQAYGHVADITDAEARRRLKTALRELAQQMTEPVRETSPVTADAPSSVEPVPLPLTPDTPPPAAVSRSASAVPAGDGSWNLPKFNEMASEPLKLRGGIPKQPVPEINIAGAIEAYLQHKLRNTPAFENRRLHVLSAPNGGVRIEVDGRYYEAVSDIEEIETRTFISEAIQEWQSTQ